MLIHFWDKKNTNNIFVDRALDQNFYHTVLFSVKIFLELTRFGMKEAQMGEIAGLIKDVLNGKSVLAEVVRLRSRFTKIRFA